MSELIKLGPDNRNEVLLTLRSPEGVRYSELLQKAEAGFWKPDPPVILSRMPPYYTGKFKFHLYNGLPEFVIAAKKGLELNGIIVDSADEIPLSRRLPRGVREGEFWDPEERLRLELWSLFTISRLDSPKMTSAGIMPMDASDSLPLLVARLQSLEAQGVVP